MRQRGSGTETDTVIDAMTGGLVPASAAPPRTSAGRAEPPYRDGHAALGAAVGPGSIGGVAASGPPGKRHVLAFHGRLFAPVEDVSPSAPVPVLLEAIAAAYRRSGSDLLRRLRGDFILAFWDEEARVLDVAVDRFRVESAVYCEHGGRFLFASRMESLLAAGDLVPRDVEPVAVADVVTSSIVPSPATIFKAVRKLPAGTRLRAAATGVTLESYWDADFRRPSGAGRRELTDAVRASLEGAAAARYEVDRSSEVVGTFLSGGVDSTAITGLVQRLSPERIRSFSIGFQEAGFNEMDYARIAARSLGVEHHEYFVTPDDVLTAIPKLLDGFDEPFANASAIPAFCCARFAREHGVTTLYAGDGGDELFAGNERYAARRVFDVYDRIPRWPRERVLRPAVEAAARALPIPPLRKARRYIERAALPYPERITSWGLLTWIPRETLFAPAFLDSIGRGFDPAHAFHDYYHQALATEILDREMYVDLKLVIADNDVLKVTRMTEAAGVGVRFPFLDSAVADVALTVPADLRMEKGVLRSFFKAAYADLLPTEVRAKRKHGFGLPIAPWLRSVPPLRALLRDTLLGARFLDRGYVLRSGIEELLRRQESDVSTFYGTILWNLVLLELWFERHGL
ncbi:MAG TPA: asparagine synthase-related protein [Candidatus Eisenbacteria bacterium]|nr:asparagine synthase-related protein [Candidatus Eisenbacteria bacterium]